MCVWKQDRQNGPTAIVLAIKGYVSVWWSGSRVVENWFLLHCFIVRFILTKWDTFGGFFHLLWVSSPVYAFCFWYFGSFTIVVRERPILVFNGSIQPWLLTITDKSTCRESHTEFVKPFQKLWEKWFYTAIQEHVNTILKLSYLV